MPYSFVQYPVAGFDTATKRSFLFDEGPRTSGYSLFAETLLVLGALIGAIRVFGNSSTSVPTWLIIPGILVVAALLPMTAREHGFQQLGFNFKNLRDSLGVLGWTCISVFPLTFCALWILKFLGLDILPHAVPRGHSLACWLLYQFMYVALAEEVFFRGYLQTNILRLTKPITGMLPRRREWASIGISAACFAAAHIIIQGHIVSALTFLPGLVLGWLFVRTGSLLAPVLFHGLANAFYLSMSVVLAQT